MVPWLSPSPSLISPGTYASLFSTTGSRLHGELNRGIFDARFCRWSFTRVHRYTGYSLHASAMISASNLFLVLILNDYLEDSRRLHSTRPTTINNSITSSSMIPSQYLRTSLCSTIPARAWLVNALCRGYSSPCGRQEKTVDMF